MAPRDFRTRLSRRAARANISLAPDLLERLTLYYELLERWNRKINLTSIDNPDEGIDRLLLEPLIAARYLPAGKKVLMDVGSGGGSPALPLTLATPGMSLRMVEIKARKAAFLREVTRQLGLESVVVETARYEELLSRPELLEAHTAVSVRAVRVETRVLHTLQAFLAPGGALFLFRGPGGPQAPAVVPPLQWAATYPLVDTLQSRLTVLTKRVIGRSG